MSNQTINSRPDGGEGIETFAHDGSQLGRPPFVFPPYFFPYMGAPFYGYPFYHFYGYPHHYPWMGFPGVGVPGAGLPREVRDGVRDGEDTLYDDRIFFHFGRPPFFIKPLLFPFIIGFPFFWW